MDHIPNRSNQLTHLDDQPVGPITTYTWPGTPVKTLNIINVEGRQGRQTDIPLTLTMGQSAVLLRTPSPLHQGRALSTGIATEYLTGIGELLEPPGEEELLNLQWDLILLQAGPVETHYMWYGTQSNQKEEKVGVVV